MSTVDPEIKRFLAALNAEGRSSPAGLAWHDFYEFLRSRKPLGRLDPPVPFILAASGESDGSKHRRLAAQLLWASENGCLDEAVRYLRAIPPDQWNRGALERWDQESYWEP